jgi:hypothetical protein
MWRLAKCRDILFLLLPHSSRMIPEEIPNDLSLNLLSINLEEIPNNLSLSAPDLHHPSTPSPDLFEEANNLGLSWASNTPELMDPLHRLPLRLEGIPSAMHNPPVLQAPEVPQLPQLLRTPLGPHKAHRPPNSPVHLSTKTKRERGDGGNEDWRRNASIVLNALLDAVADVQMGKAGEHGPKKLCAIDLRSQVVYGGSFGNPVDRSAEEEQHSGGAGVGTASGGIGGIASTKAQAHNLVNRSRRGMPTRQCRVEVSVGESSASSHFKAMAPAFKAPREQ